MSEKLDSLLERINKDGLEKAEKKSEKIVSSAEKKADSIIKKAQEESERIRREAADEAESTRAKGEKTLRQAYRDIVISVKKEIELLFNRVMAEKVSGALREDELAGIIKQVVEKWSGDPAGKVEVYLGDSEAGNLADTIVSGLQDRIKEGVEIKPVKNVDAGFMVSFDGGKSRIDFTGDGIAEFIRAKVSPRLAEILEKGEDER